MDVSNFPWINKSLYPFTHQFIELPAGRMHYIDEGKGDVLLFVHGTPAWSFLYRKQISHFSSQYRCIAIDHLGFGLSDKPNDFAGTPEAHSKNLTLFIEKLGLHHITLVVHDFGGPIGLAAAIHCPRKIKQLVVLNTWLWKTADDHDVKKVDRIVRSWLGQQIYLRTNFSPAILMKQAFHDKKHLTPEIHRHYTGVFNSRGSRLGLLHLAQSLRGSSDWYQQQNLSLDTLSDKPTLIIWGMKDAFIKNTFLPKWQKLFPQASFCKIDTGHFVQEEAPEEVNKLIGDFLLRSKKRGEIAQK